MPELPEVESVRLSLAPGLVGRRVAGVRVRRREVVEGDASARALLAGDVIDRLERRGKQLAIVGRSGRVVGVHLGMSGQLTLIESGVPRADHVHVEWVIDDEARAGRPRRRGGGVLRFRDPRRFGGVWTARSMEGLDRLRWRALGPDAAGIDARALRGALARTRRAVKGALLDQSLLAGLGNIYADESLFRAGIGPLRATDGLTASEHARLARAIRATLAGAVRAGGSSLADNGYVDGAGAPGRFQRRLRVYSRGGEACTRCGATLMSARVAQRTTVWCARCQT